MLIVGQPPGNVRELENMMERAIVLSGGKTISCEYLPIENTDHNNGVLSASTNEVNLGSLDGTSLISQVKQQLIQQALETTKDNKAAAAQLLQISERSLWYKIKKFFN